MMKPWIGVLLAILVVLINLLNWVKQVSCMTQGVFGILAMNGILHVLNPEL
jgi:hypothetical protein